MKTVLIKMIRFYQKYLSPLKNVKCPYIPTCSQYGLEAIKNTVPLREVYWQPGEFCDVTRFPKEVTTQCRKQLLFVRGGK